jgi:hypothetical protein
MNFFFLCSHHVPQMFPTMFPNGIPNSSSPTCCTTCNPVLGGSHPPDDIRRQFSVRFSYFEKGPVLMAKNKK